jgi:thiamine pyrophosphokinase
MSEPTSSGAPHTVVVFTGGDPFRGDIARLVPDGAFVVAADSGLHAVLANGLHVDHVIGDFDSVSADALATAAATGALVERHPPAKEATDLELALDRAAAMNPEAIVVIGGHGGRLDHFLANALLLGHDRYQHTRVSGHMGDADVFVVREHISLRGTAGDVVTLLPLHGEAVGVTTTGLRYPLRGETLDSGTTRGVSNEFVEPDASVQLDSGVLLVITPRDWSSTNTGLSTNSEGAIHG